MDDLNRRLEIATKKRDTLNAECRRIEGKLEAAQAGLASVEAECRQKGFDPQDIDSVIEKLKGRYTQIVTQLENEVKAADVALTPFLKEIK